MAVPGQGVVLNNRVAHPVPSALKSPGSGTGVILGLQPVGSPESLLGAVGMLATGIVASETQGGGAVVGAALTTLQTALSFNDANGGVGGIVLSAAILDALTELRALGEVQLAVMTQLLQHEQDRIAGVHK